MSFSTATGHYAQNQFNELQSAMVVPRDSPAMPIIGVALTSDEYTELPSTRLPNN